MHPSRRTRAARSHDDRVVCRIMPAIIKLLKAMPDGEFTQHSIWHGVDVQNSSWSAGAMMATPLAFATPRLIGAPLAVSSPNAL